MGNCYSCKSDYKNFGSNWTDGQICKVRLIAQYNKELFYIGKAKDTLKNSSMMGITLENSNMLMLRIVKYPSWFLLMFEGFNHDRLLSVIRLRPTLSTRIPWSITAIINDKKLIYETGNHLNKINKYIDKLIYVPTDLKKVILTYIVINLDLFRIIY